MAGCYEIRFNRGWVPVLLSSSLDAAGRGTHLRNIGRPGTLEDAVRYEQTLEVLSEGKEENKWGW